MTKNKRFDDFFFNYRVLLRFSDKLAVNLSYIVVVAGSTPSLKQSSFILSVYCSQYKRTGLERC